MANVTTAMNNRKDAGGGGWANFEQQGTAVEAAPEQEAAVALAEGGRTAAAICLYDFESQASTCIKC